MNNICGCYGANRDFTMRHEGKDVSLMGIYPEWRVCAPTESSTVPPSSPRYRNSSTISSCLYGQFWSLRRALIDGPDFLEDIGRIEEKRGGGRPSRGRSRAATEGFIAWARDVLIT